MEQANYITKRTRAAGSKSGEMWGQRYAVDFKLRLCEWDAVFLNSLLSVGSNRSTKQPRIYLSRNQWKLALVSCTFLRPPLLFSFNEHSPLWKDICSSILAVETALSAEAGNLRTPSQTRVANASRGISITRTFETNYVNPMKVRIKVPRRMKLWWTLINRKKNSISNNKSFSILPDGQAITSTKW